MRSQRATKVPLRFDNSVYMDCGDNKEDGDSDTLGNTLEKIFSMDNMGCDGISVDVDSTVDGVKNNETWDQDVKGMEQYNKLNSYVGDETP
ncbi:hypothetical protein Tco_1011713, partial [Tanacetum coccineum]